MAREAQRGCGQETDRAAADDEHPLRWHVGVVGAPRDDRRAQLLQRPALRLRPHQLGFEIGVGGASRKVLETHDDFTRDATWRAHRGDERREPRAGREPPRRVAAVHRLRKRHVERVEGGDQARVCIARLTSGHRRVPKVYQRLDECLVGAARGSRRTG